MFGVWYEIACIRRYMRLFNVQVILDLMLFSLVILKINATTVFPNRSKPDPVATLPSTYSVHEFHNYGFQGTGISPGLHFHLSGTINALTDIPLGTIHILRNSLMENKGGGSKK